MLRKRKRRTRRDTIASTLLISEARRFCSDLQYLTNKRRRKKMQLPSETNVATFRCELLNLPICGCILVVTQGKSYYNAPKEGRHIFK